MNLHSIVAPYVGAINPPVSVTVRMSTGYTTNANGTRVPSYAAPATILAQIQMLTAKDLRQIEGLNLQGTLKSIYVNGPLSDVVRPSIQGGDLVTLPDGTVWLIKQVLENWNLTAGWTKAVMVLQNDAAVQPPIT